MGDVHYAPEKWNTHAKSFLKCPDLRSAVLFAVEKCPVAFLDEVSDFVTNLDQLLGEAVVIFPSSVSRILAANGLTRKVIETAFISRNELDRARWVLDQWDIPLRARVYVDEAHRCGRSASRKWAWSLRGHRAERYLTNSRGVSTSFLVTMSHDRVLDWKITQPPPGQTSVHFLLLALETLLPHMNAYDPALPWYQQEERCVLILDNARVHDQAAIAQIQAAGVLVRLLPPYSSDSNPIEDVLSVGSSWLRRRVTPEQIYEGPFVCIALMLSSISSAMCRGFVKAAVRNYTLYILPHVSNALPTAFSRYQKRSTTAVCHCSHQYNHYQRFPTHFSTLPDDIRLIFPSLNATLNTEEAEKLRSAAGACHQSARNGMSHAGQRREPGTTAGVIAPAAVAVRRWEGRYEGVCVRCGTPE